NGYASTGLHASSASWSLDERGKIEREITGAGGVTWDRSFTYDPRGFLVDSTDATGASESWSFGASGMPATISDVHGARTLVRKGAVLTAGSRHYGYDGIGRVTSLDGVTYEYGPDGQLARASSGQSPAVGYVYDEAGNRVGKTRAGAPKAVFVGGG